MSVTDEIKARLDLVNYIHQYVPLKKAGRYYKACCPFHSEKTPSFTVNPDNQSWRCFGACAEGGDIFSFAMKHHGWTFSEALEELGKAAGVEVRKQSPLDRQRAERHEKLRGIMKTAVEFYHTHLLNARDAGEAVWEYVTQKRGFNEDTITAYAIGYAPSGWQTLLNDLTQLGYEQEDIIEAGLVIKNDKGRVYDRFRNRLMIPIRDERGRVIGFGARALNPDDNPKYLNSPQTPLFDKSHVLFGLDAAKRSIRDTETVVIVEGYMDVIQAHQAGFMNVVAQMGTAMTEAQLKKIVPRYAKKIILALDSDAAGQNATRRSLETARQTLQADYAGRLSVDIRILQSPGAKDPDDLIREAPEQWQALVDNAQPVADYVIETEIRALPNNPSIQEREAVARSVLPMLIASESDVYRHENIQKLALRLRIPERQLLQWAEEHSQQNTRQSHQAEAPARNAPDLAPTNYDALEPPPFDEDEDDADYAPEALGIAPDELVQESFFVAGDNELERHCMGALLKSPDSFYQVNRRLRELSAGNEKLSEGALCDLCVDDFTRDEYRAVMGAFLEGLSQHDMETLDFVQIQVDARLRTVVNKLLVEERAEVHQRMQHGFGADFEALWKQFERMKKPMLNTTHILMGSAIKLRLTRLKRELDEYRFGQMAAENAGESEKSLEISSQMIYHPQAIKILEVEYRNILRSQ